MLVILLRLSHTTYCMVIYRRERKWEEEGRERGREREREKEIYLMVPFIFAQSLCQVSIIRVVILLLAIEQGCHY